MNSVRGTTGASNVCTTILNMAENESLPSGSKKDIITYYFTKGFEYNAIVHFLSKFHQINMSIRTLKNRLRQYNLRRRLPTFDIEFVRDRILRELSGPGSSSGYRSMWHTLRMENIQVPRHIVEQLMRELDPDGCEQRKSRRLQRRRYLSPGPNHTWHVDGYDKLKPYGFPIHGCIDGWSRKILWLKVTKSNNHPEIIANFYLNLVSELGGCPVKLRTDCGTENGTMAAMQCTLKNNIDAHKYGTSPANQRIEGWWSFLRRNRSSWWIDFFKNLIEQDIFNPGNELQMECLWICFSQLIQNDLNLVKEHWNTHRIRRSSYHTVSGRPDELFFLPELHGGTDHLLCQVTHDEVDSLKENLTYVEEKSVQLEYFEYVLENISANIPNNCEEGLQLYRTLLDIAGTDI